MKLTGDDEILKHRKKKPSSTSKSKEKSNHKHQYEDCMLVENSYSVYKGKYCTICGKISNPIWFDSEEVKGTNLRRLLSNDEKFEKYKHLPTFHIESIFKDKYVTIDKCSNIKKN